MDLADWDEIGVGDAPSALIAAGSRLAEQELARGREALWVSQLEPWERDRQSQLDAIARVGPGRGRVFSVLAAAVVEALATAMPGESLWAERTIAQPGEPFRAVGVFDVETSAVVIQTAGGRGTGIDSRMQTARMVSDKLVVAFVPLMDPDSVAEMAGYGLTVFTSLRDLVQFVCGVTIFDRINGPQSPGGGTADIATLPLLPLGTRARAWREQLDPADADRQAREDRESIQRAATLTSSDPLVPGLIRRIARDLPGSLQAVNRGIVRPGALRRKATIAQQIADSGIDPALFAPHIISGIQYYTDFDVETRGSVIEVKSSSRPTELPDQMCVARALTDKVVAAYAPRMLYETYLVLRQHGFPVFRRPVQVVEFLRALEGVPT